METAKKGSLLLIISCNLDFKIDTDFERSVSSKKDKHWQQQSMISQKKPASV